MNVTIMSLTANTTNNNMGRHSVTVYHTFFYSCYCTTTANISLTNEMHNYNFVSMWSYHDCSDENGALGGASIEINQAICAQAGKTCSHVVTPIEKCWDSETGLGEGNQTNTSLYSSIVYSDGFWWYHELNHKIIISLGCSAHIWTVVSWYILWYTVT